MAKVKRVLRCYHCGAILQTEDKDAPGYITKSVISGKKQVLIPYCNNCYDSMLELNASVLDEQVDNDILKILDDAVATDALIIWVVDLFSFNGTINKEIAHKLRKQKVWIVGTKRDLFSGFIKDETFVRYLNERFQEVGLKPDNILIIGKTDGDKTPQFFKEFNEARQGHDIYMIGDNASGKTSLINKYLKTYVNKTKRQINSHNYEGTNQKVLEIPLSRSSSFYELPGISQTTNVVNMVEKPIAKFIVPKKAVKVTAKILTTGDALMIGSLASFEVIKGKPSTFAFYSAEGVEVRKLSMKALNKTFRENIDTKTCRPVSSRYTTFQDYDLFEYEMENDDQKHDISIEGLGWVSFTGRGQIVRVKFPKGAALKECLSKIRNV